MDWVRADIGSLLRCIPVTFVREVPDYKRDYCCTLDSLRANAWDALGLWTCEVSVAWQTRTALIALDTFDANVPADRHRGPAVSVDARSAIAQHAPGACDSLHRAQSSICCMDDARLFQRAAARVGRGSDG